MEEITDLAASETALPNVAVAPADAPMTVAGSALKYSVMTEVNTPNAACARI